MCPQLQCVQCCLLSSQSSTLASWCIVAPPMRPVPSLISFLTAWLHTSSPRGRRWHCRRHAQHVTDGCSRPNCGCRGQKRCFCGVPVRRSLLLFPPADVYGPAGFHATAGLLNVVWDLASLSAPVDSHTLLMILNLSPATRHPQTALQEGPFGQKGTRRGSEARPPRRPHSRNPRRAATAPHNARHR